ncbi:hypothetical protein K490DRAFT_56829 [Saccharata proteae CBS 121410]|uniref:PLC-like phosphodiesterase n=1 Tax=Saccharata proteae CBS 121410 TaxID=1314787 RepID=A0A9P4HTJ2_9PEZI|nr:hypothetical protein K490DRAFT_56829 [Saccharata proteae CBS 121410]
MRSFILYGIAAWAGLSAASPFQFPNTSATNKAHAGLTTRVCNNSPALCSRSYANITHLGAHDSAFIRDAANGYNSFGDQSYNTTTQLDAGVRLVSAQVHLIETANGGREWHLCHTTCVLSNAGTLSNWLSEIRQWLDTHPSDVVTILLVNSDNASAEELAAEYTAADMAHYGYVPPASTPNTGAGLIWPTLNDLVDKNTRLVTFVADLPDNSAAPYLLDEFANVFESGYENYQPADFSCAPDRPAAVANDTVKATDSGMLFLMNHFLYWRQAFGIDVPDVRNANATNGVVGVGALGTQLVDCRNVYGRYPTFVLVDFFDAGPAIESVDFANGVSGATEGRRKTLVERKASAAVGRSMSTNLVAMVAAVVFLVVSS